MCRHLDAKRHAGPCATSCGVSQARQLPWACVQEMASSAKLMAPPLGSVCSVQTLQGLHNLYASGLGPICHVPCIPIVIYNDITMLMCESRLAHADVHDKVLFQAATGQPACLRLPLCSVRPAHADMPGKASWPRIAINSTDASGRSQDMQRYYFVLIQRRG